MVSVITERNWCTTLCLMFFNLPFHDFREEDDESTADDEIKWRYPRARCPELRCTITRTCKNAGGKPRKVMMWRKRAKQTAADSGMRTLTPAPNCIPVTHSEQRRRRSLDHYYCAFPRRSPLECSSLESWLPGLGYGVRRKPVVDIPLFSLAKWRDVRACDKFCTRPEDTKQVTNS